MSNMRVSGEALLALRVELQKEAAGLRDLLANPRLHSALGAGGALGGLGLAAGALGGAGISGTHVYREARDAGATRGQALMSGAGGAFEGARKGALIGGIAGGAAGVLGGALAPGAAEGVRRAVTGTGMGVGPAARFGQRQVHALSGWRPDQNELSSIRQIGAGAHNSAERLSKAVGNANELHAMGGNGHVLQKAVGEVDHARKGYGAALRAERMGLTNIPGVASAMKEHGVVPTLSTGFKEQWHSMSPSWKALMIGAPLAEAGLQAATPDQEGGPGKGERIARGLAGAVVGSTMGALPMTTTNFVVNPIASRMAGGVGRGIDKLRHKGQPRSEYAPMETSGQVVPAERMMNEHAGHGEVAE